MLTDRQFQVAIGLGVVGAVALLAYKAKTLIKDASNGVADAYQKAKEEAQAWVAKQLASAEDYAATNSVLAPFTDSFNPDQWRPAGYYLGGVLIFATGGMELKPEFRQQAAVNNVAGEGLMTAGSLSTEQGLGEADPSWSSPVPEGADSP